MNRALMQGLLAVASLVGASVPSLRAQCPDGTPPPCDRAATPARTPPPNSVAILYFDNLSRDSADEYLADGLTEQLIVRLGRVERLDVRLRSEVQRYHGRPLTDPAAVARTLNTRYLLTGSVRKVGPRVVVTVELSQPLARRSRVWGDVIDRSSIDVLDIEAGIADSVASAVAGRLRPEERAEVTRRPTRDARAYDLFQQADAYMRRFTSSSGNEADVRSAVAFYRAALERDSAFVAAWAGLAQAWTWVGQFAPTRPALHQARLAAARALALDSTAGDALAIDAMALRDLTYDWGAAEAGLRRAARLAPRSALPWVGLSGLLQFQGRFDEAIVSADSAMARDSASVFSLWAIVTTLIDSRRWALLADWEPRLQAVSEVIATYARSYPALREGRPLDALRAYRTLPYLDLNAVIEAMVAADSVAAARALVTRERAGAEERVRGSGWYEDPDGLAAAYALLGDKDEAFRWLELAYAWGNNDLLLRLKVYPPFDRLRDDPRYHDLLRRMHLEP
jgi:TolB-like protein/tetratricopeptide (TPR) repeat protein